ncbi:MAG: ester cyclase [Kofleriaceae bacterium]
MRTKIHCAAILSACAHHPDLASPTEPGLPEPKQLIVDSHTSDAGRIELAARRLYAFWDSGDTKFLDEAMAPTFVDRTLPPGRPQGPGGAAFASKNFRAAVPDLHCDVEQLLITNDRAVAHLRFHGHFTGTFDGKPGNGAEVNFIATDILRITDGKVTDNWHLEDNLTFLKQIGAV